MREQGATLRPGGYSNAPDREPTSRARNDRRDRARSYGDVPAAPLTLNLGDRIPSVQHVKLVPIFDGLAAAADAGPRVNLAHGHFHRDANVHRHGRPVQLARKPMELLLFLVGRREQLVAREEIVAKLWRSDLFVDTESAVNNIVRKIRIALGDVSEKPRFLETVIGKGYRFIGPVHVIHARHVSADASSSSPRVAALAESRRTSLAVLPLAILGNSADDNGLGLGFADALIARLGNLNGLDVLPTSSVLPESPSASPADVAQRLGVRFVVRGAMQSAKDQWHLSVEMFDAQLQRVSYEHNGQLDLNRLFESQDQIAKNIAATLDRQLGPATAQARSISKRISSARSAR